ncbi:MAG: branched-chain amino acid ABC transporter permease [Xanthobacteraceae bacterium]|nr:MAG: branched-chain amino acid ABC transporter permease [Xanthobacteraceae bacterium]
MTGYTESLTPAAAARRNFGKGRVARIGCVLAVVALACLVPFIGTSYQTLQMTFVLIYAIALLGLNILVGYNGQLSLGHGAFFGLGAYIAAIMMHHFGLPYWSTIPVVAVLCLIGGFLFGLPALRLEGHYLALATFSLALAMPQILKYPAFAQWTGGFMGLVISPVPVPAGVPLSSDQWLYFFCLALTLVMFLIGWNLMRGRTGQAIIAIRDQPTAAVSMGINLAYYKSMTFGVSAMYAGVAGALSALTAQFVSPDSFDFFLSISLLVGIVVGGIATVSGAIFGAVFIQFIPNIAEHISKSASWAVYGVALIGFMYLMPQGVVGLIRRLRGVISGAKRSAA